MNLANKLTMFRILLVPVMVIIPFLGITATLGNIPIEYIVINVIFIIASITDQLDGYIARKRNEITTFGKFLDPLADKILVIAALVMLVEYDKLPAWIPIIVLAREFIVSGYRLVAVEKKSNVIAASMSGKIKTVTQMFAIVLAFIDVNGFCAFINNELSGWALTLNVTVAIMMIIQTIATITSGLDYLKDAKDVIGSDI